MNFPAFTEAQEKLAAKRTELKSIFDEAGENFDVSKVKSVDGDVVDAIRARNEEIDDLARDVERLKAVAVAAERVREDEELAEKGAPAPAASEAVKSLGEAFVNSVAYKARNGGNGPEAELDVSVKTLFQTSAGWAPDSVRAPGYVPSAQRQLVVADLFPQYQASGNSMTYIRESTFTNNAAEVAEGGTKPESAFAMTEETVTIRKIATHIPVTTEQLDDVAGVRDYINQRLSFAVAQRLDAQLISGNGTAPNLRGLLNVVGIQTQAKGSDPTPDAIYKAINKVKTVGFAVPDGVVLHPNDWQDIRLLRTADGVYIWGNPADAGPMRIWGLPVVETTAATENTGIVADFGNYTGLYTRQGITVKVSDSHGTNFTENKVTVLAEMRAGLAVFRPAAVCSVTGI